MAQVKVYSSADNIKRHRETLSAAIHSAIVSALDYPIEKKFQRFMSLDAADFIFPADRSLQYVIIEISLFAGRSEEAKTALIKALFVNIEQATGIDPQDIEITLFETPVSNWGIRGLPASELILNYKVDV